jgi:putative transposase
MTEVWTLRGLVTYDTVLVIELQSRRVHIAGSTPHPAEAFMLQIVRQLTHGNDGILALPCFLICDRDRTWSCAVRQWLQSSGVSVIGTPFHAPNGHAHAERCVRSIMEACLSRIVPCGAGHFRRAVMAFVAHDHRERHPQGLGNELIDGVEGLAPRGRMRRRQRVGGVLSDYYRRRRAEIQAAELSDITGPRGRTIDG